MAAEGEGPGSSNRLQGRTQDPLAEEGPQRAAGLVHGALAACPGPPEALQGPAARDGRGTLRLEAALPPPGSRPWGAELTVRPLPRDRVGGMAAHGLGIRAARRGASPWGTSLETSPARGVGSWLSRPGAVRGAVSSAPSVHSALHPPTSQTRLAAGCGRVLGLGHMPWAVFLSHPVSKAQPPAVTGCLAAAPATETSELFPEVALGQQASAPWQWLPGSARPALAAVPATAGASRGCEDDRQGVTEKGRATRGPRSGNPVSVWRTHGSSSLTLRSAGLPEGAGCGD